MTVDEIKTPRPGDKCIVCSGPPEIIGVFAPDDPQKWGATIGKTRLIRYCLCQRCHARPDTPERVEKIIRQELAGGGVTNAE
jgi:hypothetical protein